MDKTINDKLTQYQVPPLGAWDNDLGVAWFIPREVIKKITKKGRPYWIIKTTDSTSSNTTIRCWAVKDTDILHLNRPYMARLDYDDQWGFSTRSLKYNFKLLG